MGSKVAAWMCCWGALSMVGGCGKAEGGAEPIPLSELPARIAKLLCDSLAGCCKTSGIPMNVAACKTFYTVGLQEDYGEVDLQRLRYDAEAAGACLFAISAKIQCGQVDDDEPPECDRIFSGRIALDQPCMSRQDCADVAGRSVFCESQDGSSPTVCVAGSDATLAHGQAGETCSYTCYEDQTCDDAASPTPQQQPAPVVCHRKDGLFCDAGLCAPLSAPGAPCSSSEGCRDSAFCDSVTGLCTEPQTDGSPCQIDNECLSGNCADDPGAVTEPGSATSQVCISTASVTAAQCARDFALPSTESTSPGAGTTDPGSSGGAP